ncbi:MurR/RpiR family transcriptional regulator [Jeotgalicoccus halotolerans]|uniref:RpiR family transcriptional regulator n=1 Tax=Jeotgalicoccus halotolerans TaxID=157227 RepID=A0A3E0B045_9STAP|nr:MurR/RpiR family transcriptional regulator [Jeotgalicoccus halotolerans]REG25315.1 RpiR family transcriptional regulator [Jeotgalicoccus halotolerans]
MSIFTQIQDSIESASEAKKRVAYYILDNWLEAAFTTASKVAKSANVSESVVVRFSQDLGYSGFPDLQKVIQDIVKKRLAMPKTQNINTENKQTNDDAVSIVYNQSVSNLNQTAYNNKLETFVEFKEAIKNARKILIVARKNSYGPAHMLNVHINEFYAKSTLFNGETLEALDYIRGMNNEDLVIFISIPTYSSRMGNLSQYVKEKNIKQIAITDNHSTDISNNASILLITNVEANSYSNSHVSTVMIIDILNYLLALQDSSTLFKNVEEMNFLNERFGFSK